MANTQLDDLTELSTVAAGDLSYIVDVSDSTDSTAGTSKKITRANLVAGLAASGANSDITSLTGLTTPLAVSGGGTGASTLTGILLGAGTSAITALSSSGTGNVVRVTGATMVTPTLGVATATTVNKVTITAPATASTLTIAQGSSLITAGAYAITLTATATTGVTLPTTGTLSAIAGAETLTNKTLTTPVIASFYQDAGKTKLLTTPNTASDTLAAIAATQTLTNKRITKRIGTDASSATPTPAGDTTDMYTLTALEEAAAFAVPSGTPTNGQTLIVRIKDDGTARALSWNAIYRAGSDIALPTTTVISKTLYVGFVYNSADTKWDLLSVVNNI